MTEEPEVKTQKCLTCGHDTGIPFTLLGLPIILTGSCKHCPPSEGAMEVEDYRKENWQS